MTEADLPSATRARAVVSAGLALTALAAALLATFALPLLALVEQWWRHEEYSYGFLIPAFSAYMVWLDRDRLRRLHPHPAYLAGAAVIAAGILALVLGRAGHVMLLQELAFVVALVGSVLLLFGPRVLRALWFPLAYLLFMIPFWDLVAGSLYLPLQELSARLATVMLRVVGIPVFRDGLVLHLPRQAVIVAEACSGARFLISTIAIGIPLAVLFLRGWRRILLVALAVAVSLLSNGVRVALIAHLFNIGAMRVSDGVVHALQGVLVSWIGYAALFAITWGLARSQPARVAPTAEPVPGGGGGRWTVRLESLALALGLLVLGVLPLGRSFPVALDRPLDELPWALGAFHGEPAAPMAGLEALAADETLSRAYRRADGEVVRLDVRYLARQEQGRELVGEATEALQSGAALERVPGVAGGTLTVALRSDTVAGVRREQRLWYELGGDRTASRYQAKLHGALDAVRRRRTAGAVVVVTVEIGPALDAERAAALAADFIRAVIPALESALATGS